MNGHQCFDSMKSVALCEGAALLQSTCVNVLSMCSCVPNIIRRLLSVSVRIASSPLSCLTMALRFPGSSVTFMSMSCCVLNGE